MGLFVKKLYRFLSSYGLSCVLFLLFLVLTYLGTIYQVEHGLYAAREKFFDAYFVKYRILGTTEIPVMLGGYLLGALLFINLLLGGIVQARKGWAKLGVLTAHAGVLLLFVGSFITYHYATNGSMALYEGEQSSEFQSFNEWEIAVGVHPDQGASNTVTEYLIPRSSFVSLEGSHVGTFTFPNTPFQLKLSGFMLNSRAQPAQDHAESGGHSHSKVVDGFALVPYEKARDGEQNIPGLYAQFLEDNGTVHEALLWGASRAPVSFDIAGKHYTAELRKRRWSLPFTVKLNKFTRELYPGTGMPRVFKSSVTRIENGVSQDVDISMNAPMRHEGYTFYQSSYGPENARPGDPMYSVFAVVRNPADQFPLYACVVMTAGLIIHFMLKLAAYLKNQKARIES